jgi:hypothetical protein
MRAAHSVNLQKRVLACGFATTPADFGVAQKVSTPENHSKLSGLTTMRRMTRGARGMAPDRHLANLRLAHAKILFTGKIPCTSLAG